MKYKLLAIDLDGTLLKRYRKITKNNFKALKSFNDAGGQIIISTGRTITSARKIANKIENYTGKKIPYIISLCGSVIYDDKNKIVSEKLISPEITKKIADEVKKLRLNIWIYPKEIEKEGVYSKSLALAIFAKTTKNINLKKIDFNKTSMFARKINVFGWTRNKQKKFKKFIEDKLSDKVTLHKTNNWFYEICPIGSSKGEAIKIIANKLNIPLNQVAAIGDSGNDLSAAEISKCFGAIGKNKAIRSCSSENYSRLNSPVARFINERLLNKNTEIKLIGSDLDGTVLNKEKRLQKDFSIQIKQFVKNNEPSLVFATGRSVTEISRIVKQNNINDIKVRYGIANNGAVIYDLHKRKTIFCKTISKNLANSFFNFVTKAINSNEYGKMNLYFYIHDKNEIKKAIDSNYTYLPETYVYTTDEKYPMPTNELLGNYDISKNFRIISKEKLPKNKLIIKFLVFFTTPQYRDKFMQVLNKQNFKLSFSTSSQKNIEVNAAFVSKGNALRKLAKILKIKNNELLTIGDQRNDISMLKLTDWSFTFKDSLEQVKNAAKFIIERSEDENSIVKALKIYTKESKND